MRAFIWTSLVLNSIRMIYRAYMLSTANYPRMDKETRPKDDVAALFVTLVFAAWAAVLLIGEP